ncbi:MAG TPA: 2-oxoacid:acceptor oxidoreductase subunit alpha [Nitrospiria bacterium]|nr:2-oxoacid:acceptor oxidoreductase subunit alpha [Nitrospiria bacterium]
MPEDLLPSTAWPVMSRRLSRLDESLIVRFVGVGGDGVLTAGRILAEAAAWSGLEVLSGATFSAEVRGGDAMYQLRMSPSALLTEGDRVDVWVLLDRDAHSCPREDLTSGNVVLYEHGHGAAPRDDPPGVVWYPVPMTELAESAGCPVAKNVVALGALAELFGFSLANIETSLRKRLATKGDRVVASNLAALAGGARYAKEHLVKRDRFLAPVGAAREETVLVTGNEAIGLGAIMAGCRLYAHYPITPATSLAEWLAAHLPLFGGKICAAEDGIASLGVAIGASVAGVKAMTATSGPGLDLMQELIGYASMAEVPVVIVNVQRAGASTGLPTKYEQADLLPAICGAHGDAPRIVIAPGDVLDCMHLTVEAFNLAERYQVPVILLSDASLALREHTIARPDLAAITVVDRAPFLPDQGPYSRYRLTDSGISPMSVPGQLGGEYAATGLEHTISAFPSDAPDVHQAMTDKRFHKLLPIEDDRAPVEREGPPAAAVGLVSWGSTQGAVREAVRRFTAIGMPVAALYPKVLWPPPVKALTAFARSVDQVVVVEGNRQGQFARVIAASTAIKPKLVTRYRGVPLSAWDIFGREDLTH